VRASTGRCYSRSCVVLGAAIWQDAPVVWASVLAAAPDAAWLTGPSRPLVHRPASPAAHRRRRRLQGPGDFCLRLALIQQRHRPPTSPLQLFCRSLRSHGSPFPLPSEGRIGRTALSTLALQGSIDLQRVGRLHLNCDRRHLGNPRRLGQYPPEGRGHAGLLGENPAA